MTVAQLKHPSPDSYRARAQIAAEVDAALDRVEDEGARAVRALSLEVDGWNPDTFVAGPGEVAAAVRRVPAHVRADVDARVEGVARSARAQRTALHDYEVAVRPGVVLGHRHVPVTVAGCYVPEGAEHLDWAVSTIATAKAAGVPVVVAASPPCGPRGMQDATLYAMQRAGADIVLTLGGVAAVATLALGHFSRRGAEVMACRGDLVIREAAEQMRGRTGADLVRARSDVMLVADDSADARVVATTLARYVGRAPDARIVLATTSRRVAGAVLEMMDSACVSVAPAPGALRAWRDHGEVFLCQTRSEIARLCEQLTCGHVEVHAADHAWWREHLDGYQSLSMRQAGPSRRQPALQSAEDLSSGADGPWVGSFLKTLSLEQHLSTVGGSRSAAPAIVERAGA